MNSILAIKDYKFMMKLQVKHRSIIIVQGPYKGPYKSFRSPKITLFGFSFYHVFVLFHGLDNKK